MSTAPDRLVIGVGNAWRGDDGAGLATARLVRQRVSPDVIVLERDGQPAPLLDAWRGARTVVLIDASESGDTAGTVRRIDALEQPLPAWPSGTSTHGIGVADAVELARALGRLPERLVVFAIEGADFRPGAAISRQVEAATESVADAVLAELAKSGPGRLVSVPRDTR